MLWSRHDGSERWPELKNDMPKTLRVTASIQHPLLLMGSADPTEVGLHIERERCGRLDETHMDAQAIGGSLQV